MKWQMKSMLLNSLAVKNPKLAEEWHPVKNGVLKPTDVSNCSNIKVWWLGKCGHEWQSIIYSRNIGRGCPYCTGQKVLKGFNDLASTNPELAQEWHPTKNGCLTPAEITSASGKKAWWKCSNGHEWQTAIGHRSRRGDKCPFCSGRKVLKGYNDLETLNPKIAKEWHPTKNGNLRPDMVRTGSGKEVWWKCERGHEWQAGIVDRNDGTDCPECKKGWQTSVPEQIIYYYMKKAFHTAVNSYKFLGQNEIDIFIKELNLGIEYDGDRYHKDIEKDIKKNLLCKNDNITLIRIREKKCPVLKDENSFCILLENYTMLSLEKAIIQIFNFITENITKILYKTNVNILRDMQEINSLFFENQKQKNLLTINSKLAEEWHPIKNGNLTSEMITANSGRKVWWKCKKGHEWQSTIASRNSGIGCPVCSNKKILKGFNDLATINPELTAEWHPTKNGGLAPDMFVPFSGKKVWWQDKYGHEWECTIDHRSRGIGCPICSGRKASKGYNDLATVNPELAKEWHPIKNNNLTPHDVKAGSNRKVWWQDKFGHEWECAVNHRNRGTGCPVCSGRKALKGFNDLATKNPELAEDWHPTKNGSLTPCDVTAGSNKKVWWKCNNGHEWQADIYERNNGGSCSVCVKQKNSRNLNK